MRLQAHRFAHLRESPLEITVPQFQEAGSWAQLCDLSLPLVLEIGLGKDAHLIEKAVANPRTLHVGMEYSRKKLDMVLSKATRAGAENLRVLQADATRVMDALFQPESIQQLYCFFPDPWPKKRHHKKRIVQHSFLDLAIPKLISGARIELRTDHPEYFQQMLEVMEARPELENTLGPGGFSHEPRSEDHIPTLFEKKFRERNLTLHYMYYEVRQRPN